MADVRVFFATNRNHQPENKLQVFGREFNPDGVAALRFGYADYEPSLTDPKLKAITVYPDIKDEPDIMKTGGGMFLEDLRKVMSSGDRTDTLVFIHGFNVSFMGAMHAGALLAQSLRVQERPVNIVVFSWPSDGVAIPYMSYYSDREDARASGPALARAYLKFRDYVIKLAETDYCQRCVHLLTHSMGAYVLRNGLQALLAKERDSLARLFDQVMLAAPDEDDDAFETDAKLRLLPRIGRQVTVYFNPHDRGLLVSDKTKANPDRLGSDGPRMVDLLPKKIDLVDCRVVAPNADRFIEHSYYVRSEAMSRDMSAVMTGEASDKIANRAYIDRLRAFRLEAEIAIRDVVVQPAAPQQQKPPGPA